ncbi:hypothetical protein Q8F55_003382 [Vanrija albida]|uniref:Peptidase A1 domain-containing protein n=1 Tax=Vanrija albida TaxID=181172 RepID=A0ABR3Q3U9_9TREE
MSNSNTTTKTKLTVGFLVLAALAGVAVAAPADDFAAGRQLKRDLNLDKIPVINNPNHVPNFRAAVRQVELKYNVTVGSPAPRVPGESPANGGYLPLDPDSTWDIAYLAQVEIGTPPQTLTLNLDTGSSDLWVFSSDLSAADQANHDVFDYHKSTTWKPISGATFSVGYGDGSAASGGVGRDVVKLGGLTIPNQAVEIAQTQYKFAKGNNDGLVGLGYYTGRHGNKVSTGPEKTPVDNLIAQGTLPPGSQLFTSAFYSTRNPEKSFYTFGYIDEDLVAQSGQSLKWAPIDGSQGYWQFPSTTARVGGKAVTGIPSNQVAIADTGTSLALVHPAVAKALYAQIPDVVTDRDGFYHFPNSSISKLPKFEVAVGPNLWTIQPEDLAYLWDDADQLWVGGVQALNDGLSIFGDSFLKSVYAVWDRGNNRLGLVSKIQKTQNFDRNDQ